MSGPRNRKAKKQAAARAREGLAWLRLGLQDLRIIDYKLYPAAVPSDETSGNSQEDDSQSVCSWDGGVDSWSDAESEIGEWVEESDLQDLGDEPERGDEIVTMGDMELSVIELEGSELIESIGERETLKQKRLRSVNEVLMRHLTARDWSGRYGAERRQRLGVYNGLAPRTIRLHKQMEREQQDADAQIKETYVYFTVKLHGGYTVLMDSELHRATAKSFRAFFVHNTTAPTEHSGPSSLSLAYCTESCSQSEFRT